MKITQMPGTVARRKFEKKPSARLPTTQRLGCDIRGGRDRGTALNIVDIRDDVCWPCIHRRIAGGPEGVSSWQKPWYRMAPPVMAPPVEP